MKNGLIKKKNQISILDVKSSVFIEINSF